MTRSTPTPITCTLPAKPFRVALVSDLIEEKWPSMELVSDMLLENLELQHSSEFVATRLRPHMQRRFSCIPVSQAGPFFNNVDRFINRFVDYPFWLQRQMAGFDLFHVIDHSYAQLVRTLRAKPTIVTCHDLDTFGCILNREQQRSPRWFRAMTERILDGFRQADHVIAVSAATRDEILRHGLFSPHQVSVVHNGVHPSCSPEPVPAADAEADRLFPDLRGARWLLNVGSTMPRKRLDVLLQVFAAVRRKLPGIRLLRVGGPMTPAQQQLARDLEVENEIVEAPPLTRDVLAAVYRRADLLLHTAEAEGFGLPLIEAMACGCPVVATDLPVLREIGGAEVAYCSLMDFDAWTQTIADLLIERVQQNGARELRRKRAIAHAARFSWPENARRTAQIYREVLLSEKLASPLTAGYSV